MYRHELPHPSAVGEQISVAVWQNEQTTVLAPFPVQGNYLEMYVGTNTESVMAADGEVWEALVCANAATGKRWDGKPFDGREMLCVKVQLLSRVETKEETLDRTAREWVVERKSGMRVLETTRTPVKILQKKVLEGDFQVTIERLLHRDTSEIVSEYELERKHVNIIHGEAIERLRQDALSRMKTR